MTKIKDTFSTGLTHSAFWNVLTEFVFSVSAVRENKNNNDYLHLDSS